MKGPLGVLPGLWQSLQFGDRNAFVDFLGSHDLWHAQLDAHLLPTRTTPYGTISLGDGPIDDGGDWHQAHQARHVGENLALGIPPPPDFTAYDLNRRDDFNTYTWIHAQESLRQIVAAGI